MKAFDPAAFEEQLQRINELALWDFELAEFENGTLLILGSNDFVYYHYLEVELRGVTFTDLPQQFSHAQFRLGKDGDEQATVWVTAESWAKTGLQEHEIRASAIEVRVGKVYYYDRQNLLPGERIASPRK